MGRKTAGLTPEQIEEIAEMSLAITSTPRGRLEFQHLAKQANPELVTPELDQALATQELNERLESVSTEFQAYKQQVEEREKEMAEWAEVISANACTYSDIREVQKFMQENGITNKMYGAKAWTGSKQIAEPTVSGSRTFDMPKTFIQKWKDAGSKGLAQMARDEAYIALQEYRSGKAG